MAITSDRSKLIFKKTERNLLTLGEGYRPDVVHNFRTTTRRLQVLIEELIPGYGRNEKKLLKQLGRIRKRAGRIRDIDVQLAALRSLKVPLEPRRKTELTQHLLELRRKQEKKLGKLLKKRTVSEMSKRLHRSSKIVSLKGANDALQSARRMLASVADANARVDEDRLHLYRTTVKRARYAAEFAPRSPEADRLIAQLKTLQDALGRWHDWFTLTQTAKEHLGDIHQSSLVAALHNVTRGKFREASTELSAMRLTPGSLSLVPTRKQNAKSPDPKAQPGTAA